MTSGLGLGECWDCSNVSGASGEGCGVREGGGGGGGGSGGDTQSTALFRCYGVDWKRDYQLLFCTSCDVIST